MTPATLLLFVFGLVLLVIGAESLVRGASRLAAAAGISPLVIGLTVVAFGTSAPELAVSLKAGWSGVADLAVGNVVGSNICNVLLILGLSAVVAPMAVASQLLRFDVWIMLAASVAVLLLGWNGVIGRLEGAGLFAAVLLYTAWLIRQSRRETAEVRAEYEREFADLPAAASRRLWPVYVLQVLVGLGGLVLGARWLLIAAVAMARAFGVSELVIGLTVIAVGTSLPEIAASLVAAIRGERDIAVGNIVGSNIFNILCVLGLTAAVCPSGIPVSPAALRFDIPVMIAVAIVCVPVFFRDRGVDRYEGLLFLVYYVVYTAYLIMAARQHPALAWFRPVMLYVVLPLTAVGLAVATGRGVARQRRSSAEAGRAENGAESR